MSNANETGPRVAARMHEMIRVKLGDEVIGARGDIVTEELEEGETEDRKSVV